MNLESAAWMVEALGYPTFTEDPSGVITLNAPARRMLNETPGDLPDVLNALVGTGAYTQLESSIEFARAGTPSTVEVNGLSMVLMPSPGGASLIIPRNPDELAALENRAAAGEMAASVAHEVSNAMSSVIGWCSLAMSNPVAAPPQVALERIMSGAEIARGAALQLMRWGAPLPEPDRVEIGALLTEIAGLLRPAALDAHVDVQIDSSDEPLFVQARRHDLISVIWNLAKNAIRALHEGGTLRLVADGSLPHARIHVIDNGPGMSPELARNATRRRFTTNADGFGLGLPTVLRTLEAMDGSLGLWTEIGAGCHFTVDLPLLHRSTPAMGLPLRRTSVGPAPGPVPPPSGKERILVVEDDAGVRGLLKTMLELQGYEVEATGDPDRALAASPRCQIALIDLHLGSTRGDRLLASLRLAGFRGVAAIMSGSEPTMRLSPEGVPDRWLRKPFDPAGLIAKLQELRGVGNQRAAAAGTSLG